MKNCSIARNTVSINYEGLYMAKQLFAISIKGIYTAGVMEKDGFYRIWRLLRWLRKILREQSQMKQSCRNC